MNLSIVTLCAVFLMIAIRQVGRVRLQIWHIMLLGAIVVVAGEAISPADALRSINADVMLFLLGMFIVGSALEESGYLAHISYRYFKRARSLDTLLFMVLFGAGIASAFLMNDTLAIIGTPVMLLLARKHEMEPKVLLLALCIAITIGSVMSPIGNPQNLLIALNGSFGNPFVPFFRWLFIPTIINLLAAYWLLKHFYGRDFHDAELRHSQEPIRNHDLAQLCKTSLGILLFMVAAKIGAVALVPQFDFRLTLIAVTAALPIVVGSRVRWKIIRRVDWPTLAFFGAMFVLMESVWRSGTLQDMLRSTNADIRSTAAILTIGVLGSQLVSNVPLVALFQPLIQHAGAGTKEFMALAAGSTIAGNLFILGAASNVIVIQNAERRSHHTITFLEFAKVGVPLTVVNMLVCWMFLTWA